MKTCLSLVVAVAACLTFTSMASAQRGPGGPGGFGRGMGGLGLLRMEEVQKELGITDDQKSSITKLQEDLRGERPQGRPSEEERAKLREQMEARATKENEELAKVLKPEQLKRLHEIKLQVAGWAALANPEVSKELAITDEQKEKITKLTEESRAAMRGLFAGGSGGADGSREKIAEARKAADEKYAAVLTDDQKKKFEELKGAKFTMPEGGRRPGGRGRPENN